MKKEMKVLERLVKESLNEIKSKKRIIFGKDNINLETFAIFTEAEDIISADGLFDWLVDNKYLKADNDIPYQKYIDSGYFKVLKRTYDTAFGSKVFDEVFVTKKGQVELTYRLLKELDR